VEQETLPASYMNFIFVNGGLIVPTYRSPDDEEALAFFRKVFLTREVIGIDCTLVIEEGGSLHCLSKQEPLFG
jgi:agmatine deiminase